MTCFMHFWNVFYKLDVILYLIIFNLTTLFHLSDHFLFLSRTMKTSNRMFSLLKSAVSSGSASILYFRRLYILLWDKQLVYMWASSWLILNADALQAEIWVDVRKMTLQPPHPHPSSSPSMIWADKWAGGEGGGLWPTDLHYEDKRERKVELADSSQMRIGNGSYTWTDASAVTTVLPLPW